MCFYLQICRVRRRVKAICFTGKPPVDILLPGHTVTSCLGIHNLMRLRDVGMA
jgi:hypothetical protein